MILFRNRDMATKSTSSQVFDSAQGTGPTVRVPYPMHLVDWVYTSNTAWSNDRS
jgi:hypothetical protein